MSQQYQKQKEKWYNQGFNDCLDKFAESLKKELGNDEFEYFKNGVIKYNINKIKEDMKNE